MKVILKNVILARSTEFWKIKIFSTSCESISIQISKLVILFINLFFWNCGNSNAGSSSGTNESNHVYLNSLQINGLKNLNSKLSDKVDVNKLREGKNDEKLIKQILTKLSEAYPLSENIEEIQTYITELNVLLNAKELKKIKFIEKCLTQQIKKLSDKQKEINDKNINFIPINSKQLNALKKIIKKINETLNLNFNISETADKIEEKLLRNITEKISEAYNSADTETLEQTGEEIFDLAVELDDLQIISDVVYNEWVKINNIMSEEQVLLRRYRNYSNSCFLHAALPLVMHPLIENIGMEGLKSWKNKIKNPPLTIEEKILESFIDLCIEVYDYTNSSREIKVETSKKLRNSLGKLNLKISSGEFSDSMTIMSHLLDSFSKVINPPENMNVFKYNKFSSKSKKELHKKFLKYLGSSILDLLLFSFYFRITASKEGKKELVINRDGYLPIRKDHNIKNFLELLQQPGGGVYYYSFELLYLPKILIFHRLEEELGDLIEYPVNLELELNNKKKEKYKLKGVNCNKGGNHIVSFYFSKFTKKWYLYDDMNDTRIVTQNEVLKLPNVGTIVYERIDD